MLFIFNFDGTCNEPKDAKDEKNIFGKIKDDSITNIVKFHLLCGGSLAEQGRGWHEAQKCYYYSGVGTYGNSIQKVLNALFSPKGSDVKHILQQAIKDFDESTFNAENDLILITGFSRGAALGRRFAKIISDRVTRSCIYEAVFDTVASIGAPNISKKDRPKSEVVFENHSLPINVIKALHLVSLDEKRRAFQPTLMNHSNKVTEIWFSGAHADVGGGYNRDGLSDVAMRFCMNWLNDLNIGLIIKRAVDIDFTSILPSDLPYQISADDVIVNPKPIEGISHEQDRWLPFFIDFLSDRRCCVIENDKISSKPPIIHHSVANRIYHDQDYRPQSLKGVEHELIYQNDEKILCKGLQPHIELPQQNITVLDVGEEKLVTVFSCEKYNRTALYLQADKTYIFQVDPNEKWQDGGIVCEVDGWDRDSISWGIKGISIMAMEPFRRVADAKWFELCASIGAQDKEVFRIGKNTTYTPKTSGEFSPFANDLECFYGNNSGKIHCLVKRIS